ncbi:PREDICTED: LRR receptor-like serine/threonine-protein kinase GSO2 isoform X2 [Lupinus angustifolius]|uniref:LRR receptor-like serine/threonine-protein kinase GSO2 isoform X2 n=1 Tax=Lupinus angustifolius TaxID=3871 RepID=UPI00092F61B1|nr:PREDICTED: LRR receptor-like serine/threonine-protein kinase GSO2 isoform X2 [Lupinus angustifolius]
MFTCRFYLFCLVTILYICLCVGNSNIKKCVEAEKNALLKFKAKLIDKNDLLSSWKGQEDCCIWKGVTCDNSTGHVILLDLRPPNINLDIIPQLGGNIDSSLCELQNLISLDLSFNQLEGKIPQCIGSLVQLTYLDLDNNGLVGAIPHSLGNLSNLQILDLGNNEFLFANHLEWVSTLSNLTYLDLSYTNLSQVVDILSPITKLPDVWYVGLDFCGLPQFNLKSIPLINSSNSLHSLGLRGNYFSSLSWVFNVSKVIGYLDLSFNSLQQSILDEFENMTSLECLRLSNNKLQGSIPKSFQSLCQLEILDLSSNKLSGQFSDYMQHLCSGGNVIIELELSNNQLNGTLPYNIGQLSSLQRLSIYSNQFSGVINESHLSNLSNLAYLYVDRNPLSFNLSSNWIPPFQLIHLSASSCNLGPNFPLWLKHQRKLMLLQISNNGISDYFPEWFWELTPSLAYLNVSHNKLSGVLPKSILNMENGLSEVAWDFSFNNFSGPLPSFPPQLTLLSVSNNMFSRSISSLCETSYQNLAYLDLSSNSLSGRLLDCWGQFQNLQVLNLATNNFLGRIPDSFGTLQSIETIHLNNNNFTGEFPPLANCSNLKLIDFGDNNIEGTIPTWVGENLHQMIILRLRSNKFQGSIPESLCNLSHVQVLDLSNNNITGNIPQCLDHMTALSNTTFSREPISYETHGYIGFEDYNFGSFSDKAILAWKGANREYGKNLRFLTAIDFSCNQLKGQIPQSMTILIALASLNLSSNNLIGFIPNNIGHMEMLESLDLSKNYLSGTIPESLSNLSFLSYLQLSFNSLFGKIPSSTQLKTFDAYTYIGNPNLCGPPLSKDCPEDSSNIHRNDVEGDDDGFISFGFYISMGLGFVIGFWGVCGTLILKTSWRYAYFQFFNNMCE